MHIDEIDEGQIVGRGESTRHSLSPELKTESKSFNQAGNVASLPRVQCPPNTSALSGGTIA
jgi:hypothetical protein